MRVLAIIYFLHGFILFESALAGPVSAEVERMILASNKMEDPGATYPQETLAYWKDRAAPALNRAAKQYLDLIETLRDFESQVERLKELDLMELGPEGELAAERSKLRGRVNSVFLLAGVEGEFRADDLEWLAQTKLRAETNLTEYRKTIVNDLLRSFRSVLVSAFLRDFENGIYFLVGGVQVSPNDEGATEIFRGRFYSYNTATLTFFFRAAQADPVLAQSFAQELRNLEKTLFVVIADGAKLADSRRKFDSPVELANAIKSNRPDFKIDDRFVDAVSEGVFNLRATARLSRGSSSLTVRDFNWMWETDGERKLNSAQKFYDKVKSMALPRKIQMGLIEFAEALDDDAFEFVTQGEKGHFVVKESFVDAYLSATMKYDISGYDQLLFMAIIYSYGRVNASENHLLRPTERTLEALRKKFRAFAYGTGLLLSKVGCNLLVEAGLASE